MIIAQVCLKLATIKGTLKCAVVKLNVDTPNIYIYIIYVKKWLNWHFSLNVKISDAKTSKPVWDFFLLN